MIYALVRDGVVVNTVEWDGKSKWTPPEGFELVRADCSIGDTKVGDEFIAPARPAQPADAPDEIALLKARVADLEGRSR